jgi:hypothetical protein
VNVTVVWEAVEPCPAECGRHESNGSDYHRALRVEWYSWALYRVVLEDNRLPLPAYRGGYCARCGFVWETDAVQHWCELGRSEACEMALDIAREWPEVVRHDGWPRRA